MTEPLNPLAAETEEVSAQLGRFIGRLKADAEREQRIATLIREVLALVKAYPPNPDLERVIYERVYAVRTDADIAAIRGGLPALEPHYHDAVWADWLEAHS